MLNAHEELLHSDYDRRVEFCSSMIDKINSDRRLMSKICFTDETCFFLKHAPNRQNSRVWAQENPHLLTQPHTQYPQKTNVSVGLLGGHLIGPVFYDYNLNGENFLQLLQNEIVPGIRNVSDDHDLYFQLDGCPAHNAREVRDYLQTEFPGRIIGLYGDIPWPPRSPDLAPNDFFLWGHIKTVLYQHGKEYAGLDELKRSINTISEGITCRQLANVRGEFYDRLSYCVHAGGNIFEHLI